jgi:serine/threonine protein kinase
VIGDCIAERYEVRSVLGEGGMGIVYRCYDRHRNVDVALKQVTVPEGSSTRDYLAWFYKEARALATLDHPGIVHATDFGQLLGGSPYLVMEFVTGASLHDLGHVQLSYPVIWSIVDQILDALAHAHARRVIHGDLKPSNVIVETRPRRPPRVHILDLGLAWLKEDPHDERLDGAKAMEF